MLINGAWLRKLIVLKSQKAHSLDLSPSSNSNILTTRGLIVSTKTEKVHLQAEIGIENRLI